MKSPGLVSAQSVGLLESNLGTQGCLQLPVDSDALRFTDATSLRVNIPTQSIRKITASAVTSSQSTSVSLTWTTLTGIDGTTTHQTYRRSVQTATA